jgi:hypothetical protein
MPSYVCTRTILQTACTIFFALRLPYRPDVASQLTSEMLETIFKRSTDASAAIDGLAALLLLPEDWGRACEGRASTWLSSYFSAVMQDRSNAEKMVAYLAKRLAALSPGQPAQQQPGDGSGGGSSSGSVGAVSLHGSGGAGARGSSGLVAGLTWQQRMLQKQS